MGYAKIVGALVLSLTGALFAGCTWMPGSFPESTDTPAAPAQPKGTLIVIPGESPTNDTATRSAEIDCMQFKDTAALWDCLFDRAEQLDLQADKILNTPISVERAAPVKIKRVAPRAECGKPTTSKKSECGGLSLTPVPASIAPPTISLPPMNTDPTASFVGDRSRLAYSDGWLVYSPFWPWQHDLKVQMTEQVVTQGYQCPTHIVGHQHRPSIVVTYAVKPTRNVEKEFHRFVAIYGAIGTRGGVKDFVNHDDIKAGVTSYLGQHQERLCAALEGRSLSEMRYDKWLGWADPLTKWAASDPQGYFEITVQTTKVVIPEELEEWLEQKGAELVEMPTRCPARGPTSSRNQCERGPA